MKGTGGIIVIIAVFVLLSLMLLTKFKKLMAAPNSLNDKEEELKSAYKIFPLKKGSSGEEVKLLQSWLNSKSLPPLSMLDVDGYFGEVTEERLIRITNKSNMSYGEYLNIKS